MLNPHFVAGEHGLFGGYKSENIRTFFEKQSIDFFQKLQALDDKKKITGIDDQGLR